MKASLCETTTRIELHIPSWLWYRYLCQYQYHLHLLLTTNKSSPPLCYFYSMYLYILAPIYVLLHTVLLMSYLESNVRDITTNIINCKYWEASPWYHIASTCLNMHLLIYSTRSVEPSKTNDNQTCLNLSLEPLSQVKMFWWTFSKSIASNQIKLNIQTLIL